VVVLTSSRMELDLIKSYDLGVNAYVVKPVRFDEFVKAVKELGAFWAILNEAPPGSVLILFNRKVASHEKTKNSLSRR